MTQNNFFTAGVFHSSFKNGKASGQIQLENQKICFQNESVRREWFLSEIEVEIGGASNRMIFFKNRRDPDWIFFSSDQNIFNHEFLLKIPSFSKAIQKRKKVHFQSALFVFISLVLAISIFLSLFKLKNPIVNKIAEKIPPKLELHLGEMIFSQMSLSQHIISDSLVNEDFEKMTQLLKNKELDSHYKFRFVIVNDSTVNAFALPGGPILIHSALILKAESADELLGVLSHEMAHITKRHSLKQLISSSGVYFIIQALLGDVGGVIAALADKGSYLLTLKFSRDFEMQADEVGFNRLMKLDLNPQGMITFFEKMSEDGIEKTVGEKAMRILSFVSTHPQSVERSQKLKNMLSQSQHKQINQTFREIPVDFKKFQVRIKNITEKKEESKK